MVFLLLLPQIEEEEADDSLDISISVSDPEKVGECVSSSTFAASNRPEKHLADFRVFFFLFWTV